MSIDYIDEFDIKNSHFKRAQDIKVGDALHPPVPGDRWYIVEHIEVVPAGGIGNVSHAIELTFDRGHDHARAVFHPEFLIRCKIDPYPRRELPG